MNRRVFAQDSLVGLAGLLGFAATFRKSMATLLNCVRVAQPAALDGSSSTQDAPNLFPTDLPSKEWVELWASGFSGPVSGVIYRSGGLLPTMWGTAWRSWGQLPGHFFLPMFKGSAFCLRKAEATKASA